MNTAAIYHRPESEFAYLYTEETMHIRLRTAKATLPLSNVQGDPYLLGKEKVVPTVVNYEEVSIYGVI